MAAITNYGTLKTEVSNWLNRTTLATDIPGFIQAAEEMIYSEVRVPDMLTRSTGTLSGGDTLIEIDLGSLIELVFIKVGDRVLEYRDPTDIIQKEASSWDGDCRYFTTGTTPATDLQGYIVFPSPQGSVAYTVEGYFKYPSLGSVSGDSDTNFLLSNYSFAFLSGSLLFANMYLKDDAEIVKWQNAYNQSIARIKSVSSRQKYPPGELRIRSA